MGYDPTSYSKAFGATVRSLRRARGLIQDEHARRAGIGADTLRRVERGHSSPSLVTIAAISNGLTMTPSRVLEAVEFGDADDPARELGVLFQSLAPGAKLVALATIRALADRWPPG